MSGLSWSTVTKIKPGSDILRLSTGEVSPEPCAYGSFRAFGPCETADGLTGYSVLSCVV